jgi:DNA-binding response OmpR family regulator
VNKILLIDDDKNLTELLGAYLKKEGYEVLIAENGKEGIREIYQNRVDIVILDVTMPIQDGWETLERIRELSDLPVIMLTSRSDEPEVLRGFAGGVDDYVTKPFSFAQLGARIQALLSRFAKEQREENDVLVVRDISIDHRTKQVIRDGTHISLTPTELRLLTVLMENAGNVVSPEELVKEVWGPQYAKEVGHVKRYIWHLRKIIELDSENPIYIQNARGFGYQFQE